jgi:hypothetical protein
MDAHVARHAFAQPRELLGDEEAAAADFAARHFACSHGEALKALRLLAKADRQLRRCRLPQLCYQAMRLDERLLGPLRQLHRSHGGPPCPVESRAGSGGAGLGG